MPNYDIFILPESEMSFSGGAQLDGVSQGDGSHLVGQTITLNSNSWQPIAITDDDTDFEDNGGNGQNLTNAVTIDGVSFAAGSRVEAEYSLQVSDGTTTYTVIGFNIATGSPSFGTIEALAFIGPVGGFPPIGVPLTVLSNQEGPSNPAVDHASPPCFVKGTRILTNRGERAVEELRVGDMIKTLHHGLRPIRWIGSGTFPAHGRCAPIRFAAGVLGNDRPLLVSPQHRVFVEGWKPHLLFGEEAVLAPAHAFLDSAGVTRIEGGFVTYFHLMFDTHELIWSDGALTESFFAGAVDQYDDQAGVMEELRHLFPLAGASQPQLALKALKAHEAQLMLSL